MGIEKKETRKPFRLDIAQRICRFLPPLIAQRIRDLIYPIHQAYKDDYRCEVSSQTGSIFIGRTSDYCSYSFCVHGYYDWRLWAIALALCKPGDSIIEVGANVGTETIGFSDIVGEEGKVYAFEPSPKNLEALNQTLTTGGIQNVVVLPIALGDRCQKMGFSTPSDENSGVGYLLPRGEERKEFLEVECRTLDYLSDHIAPAKILFMDVEGAEALVILGAKNYISNHQPALVLEVRKSHQKRFGYNPQVLYNEIGKLGYEIFQIARLSLVRPSLSADHTTNWLCLPSSQVRQLGKVKRYIRFCGLLPCIAGINPMSKPNRLVGSI